MYTLSMGDHVARYDDRHAAIAAAKLLTSEGRSEARIVGALGREFMTYAHGELENYVFETHLDRLERTASDD